jgi:hypothetical protein
MINRSRSRQVVVGQIHVNLIGFSGVLQVGDVFDEVSPFSYGEAYGGYRGAASFVTGAVLEPSNTRLHYANQFDEDVRDSNQWGDFQEVPRPNIRGEKAR